MSNSHQQHQQQQQSGMNNMPSSSSAPINSTSIDQVMTKKTLQDLVKDVDPNEQLDEDVEEVILNYSEEYLEQIIEGACVLAKHRGATSVESKDVQMYLERNLNVWIPGFGNEDVRQYKRSPITEAHKQRMALIKKTIKKY